MPSYFQTCRSNNARLRQPCLNGIVNFELDSFDHYMLPRVGRMALLPTTQPRKLCTLGTVRFSNSGSPDLNLVVFVPDLNSCTYRCFSLCDMIPHVTQKVTRQQIFHCFSCIKRTFFRRYNKAQASSILLIAGFIFRSIHLCPNICVSNKPK